MRLPFLQLESDLLAHGAAGVAALLGCPVPQALGHIALLRAWAVSRGPGDAAPDGWVPGDNAARLVAAGAHWTGDPGLFTAALGDPGIGLLDVHRDGIRVTGLEPYAEAWDKNTKARERLRKFRERNAYETRTFADGNAYVPGQTQTQKEEDLPPPSSAAPREELRLEPMKPPHRVRKPKPEKPTDPRHAPLVQQLVDACQEVTGRPYRFNGGIDAVAVKALLSSADQDAATRGEAAPAEVVRRWRIGLAWRWANGEAPVQDLPALQKRWNSCASTATAPPSKVSTGPTMSDFSSVLGNNLYGTEHT